MPYGQVLVDTVKDSLNNTLAPSSAVFRNRIINGAMVIDQRNAGASVTPTDNQFSVDRFACRLTQASKYSAQQNAGSVTPPTGYTNYLGATSLSAYSVVAGDFFFLSNLFSDSGSVAIFIQTLLIFMKNTLKLFSINSIK